MHHHCMHVENELVEFVTAGEQKYEEVIKEYEKEVLVQEKVPEPSLTNLADTLPAQGKPQCITLILNNHWIYISDVHLCYRIYIETTYIDNLPMSPTSIGRVAAMLRLFGSMSNLPLLTIGDYYNYSQDTMIKGKIET